MEEDTAMRLKQLWWRVLVAAMLGGLVGVTAAAAAAGAQFLPVLGVREGALRSAGIPQANGFIDYVTLLNERDGGINGVPLVWEECETVYDVPRGIECYERLKAKGAAVFPLAETPLAHALTERARHDQIPLILLGGGRADAADGRVFPYVFNPPVTWWSLNTAKIRFLGQRVGGLEQLKGRKIAHVYRDDAYGRETLPMLDTQAAQYGFVVQHLAVPPPGLDQKATWLRVKVAQPDWVILRTSGIETTTALKEAAQVGFLRDKIVGPHPTCTEQNMIPAGEAAIGFICASVHGTGRDFPLIQDILTYVYARGKGAGPEGDVGTTRWIRGVLQGVLTAEGLRTAMRHFGHQPLTGAQVQWGFEHLTLTAARLKELGAEGLLPPLTLSCRDHEGGGGVKFQQWDGTQWTVITDWIATDQALVRPLVETSAAKYAQEKGITPRDCP
jgi:branched-chain amino acid transport system substrate-binding protein